MKIIKKKWGEEKIIKQEPYGCKVMTLYPGGQCSLHLHREKSECFVLVEGSLIVESINPQDGSRITSNLTEKYSYVIIPKMVPHTFYCPAKQKTNTVFIESSTIDDPKDSYRITQSISPGEVQ